MSEAITSIEPGSIAIVGMAGRFPAARTPRELWRLLAEGREATHWASDDELRAAGVGEDELADPNYVRATLALPDMEMFDADFFGFSKRDAAVLDPQHRHFLECAWEALEDAGHMPETFDGAIGVFGGCGMQAYLPYNLLSNPGLVKAMGLFLLRHTGNDKDFLCSRVSYLLDLKGPSLSVQTACSTSLVAVHVASQSLLSGECDMALAGGVTIDLPHGRGYRYAEGEILSPDGHCRAFDDSASGTIFGSGAAVVVLRRLEDALRDNDNIYAVIRGSAVNNDGSRKAGYFAPSVDGQARAAAEALAVSGVDAATVQYIEAHGTGTPVGDPIEVAALTQAYAGADRGACGIGSLKTNIGHLDTAAGAAALIKVALSMRNELMPPSLNFERANSRVDMANSPFSVVDQARPWPRAGEPRRAAVNSLGVGGTNAHVIVEEAPASARQGRADAPDTPQVFTFSARTAASLDKLKAKWVDFLASPPADFNAADAAYTLQVGRRAFEHRAGVVASSAAELRERLQARHDPRAVSGKAQARDPGVVFMFPGGGAHYPGAGRELLSQAAFRDAVDACFRLMPPEAPADLRDVMFEREASDAQASDTLEQPRYAIPALFVLEYAIAQLWRAWGVQPAAVIGHSAGDYAAACIAGVIGLADALALVVLRGQLFELAPAGSMLSVDLTEQALGEVIGELPVDVAAINAPDLCIASGGTDAIDALQGRLAARGLDARRLRISVAAHSRLLDGVLDRFRERVARIRFNAPSVRFVSNLTSGWADAGVLTQPDYWVRHLREPVRFAQGLALLADLPDAVLIETGPGQGLCALARQNMPGTQRLVAACTGKAHDPHGDLALMLAAAAGIWTRGGAVSLNALRPAGPHRRISLPTYAFDHQRHWIEPGVQVQLAPAAAAATTLPATTPARRAPALSRLPRIDDWFRVPQWVDAPSQDNVPNAAPGHWLVFGDASPLCSDFVARARAGGARVTRVRQASAFSVEPDGGFLLSAGSEEHHQRMLRALEQDASLPDRIVHLWPMQPPPPSAAQGEPRLQTAAFDSLVHLGKALQALDIATPMRLLVATSGSQPVHGERVAHAEQALVLGACRVLTAELPQLSARVVDLPAESGSDSGSGSGSAAQALLQEALHDDAGGDDDDLAAWRGGRRLVQRFVQPPAAQAAHSRLRDGGVYLITGGLGDIALELASHLARRHKARLALVGRRAVPPKANWRGLAASGDHSAQVRLVRRLLALEDEGAQVMTIVADVTDRRAMARAIAECKARFGTLNGVFHAAGALDDAPIAIKTPESIQRVLGAKAGGARVLHELLPPGELDLFALFSSTSVLLAAPGQVDYAAANAYLDALAASRDDGLTIRWGVWGDRGMAARAWGAHTAAVDAQPGSHPLLGAQVDSDNGAAFEANYDPQRLWVLQEHRVAGRAVLPGSAYIEIAHAAMMALHPRCAIEIRSLSFEEPMLFDGDARRVVRVELRRAAAGYDFVVRSRGPREAHWLEHARASTSVFLGVASGLQAPRARPWQAGAIAQDSVVEFGPRWRNLARMQLDDGSAQAQLELPAHFHADTDTYAVHPALTDMAATFGLHLVDAPQRADHLFVPISIDRIRLLAPLPPQLSSRVILKDAQHRLASFDVSLHGAGDETLATFEGFTLRGVEPAAVARFGHSSTHGLADEMLACGIQAQDAPALFDRIFAGDERDILVSSIDIGALRLALADARPRPAARPEAGAGNEAPEGAPLNPVESVLAEVWSELLGVSDVAGTDDFFALGGHSLAAVRLFARIRKHYNVDLPLATLFQAPTLAALAALVAQQAGIDVTQEAGAAAQADLAAAKKSNVIPLGVVRTWSPLVAICRGDQDRTPLFCVHGAGGNVLNFKVISDRLGTQQPFYGLQAQGVDGRLPPLGTVENMAAQYVEAIRGVQATGPYQLAGYSAGGVIALEMAHQLRRDGASVSLLAMVDTLSPSASRRKVSRLTKLWLMRKWTLEFLLAWPGRRRRWKESQVQYTQALQRLARGEPLPPELVEHHLFYNFVDAQSRYEPQVYDGDMVLFKASQSDTEYLGAGDALGWEAHITGHIDVTEIAGSHFTMMSEPGVSQLIDGLRRALGLDEPPPRTVSGAATTETSGALNRPTKPA